MLPQKDNTLTEQIIFADISSVMIPSQNFDFSRMSDMVLSHMIIWVTTNSHVLNANSHI
jgi:hypothetical protein